MEGAAAPERPERMVRDTITGDVTTRDLDSGPPDIGFVFAGAEVGAGAACKTKRYN